jgi:DNA-binding LacI/PurR family transcriptional regulator
MKTPAKRTRTSLRDIAAELNVSTAAVSRALNDLPGVGPELRLKAKETAARLGYAKYLKTSLVNAYERSMKFVAVVHGAVGGGLIGQMEPGISGRLRARGYHEIRYLVDAARELPTEGARRVFFERLASEKGIVGILASHLHLSDVLIRRLYDLGVPVVLIEHPTGYGRCAVIDQVRAARRAVERFCARGRRRIGCILPPEDEAPVWRDRLLGYRRALKDRRLRYDPARIVHPDWVGVAPGERATRDLLARAPDTDAILYGSDALAAGGLKALRELGRPVPADVAVIGFDDDEFAAVLHPPLASVRQPFGKLAQTALHLLFESIENGDHSPRTVTLESQLVLRDSCP